MKPKIPQVLLKELIELLAITKTENARNKNKAMR